MTTLYARKESLGGQRRYAEWGASEDARALPLGAHLVVVRPGCTSTAYGVEPARAALLAAAREAHDAMVAAMLAESSWRGVGSGAPLDVVARAHAAMRAVYEAAGYYPPGVLQAPGAATVVEAGLRALVAAAEEQDRDPR